MITHARWLFLIFGRFSVRKFILSFSCKTFVAFGFGLYKNVTTLFVTTLFVTVLLVNS